MQEKRHNSRFNLPILLSFNELAWILIFGIGLYCSYLLTEDRQTKSDAHDKLAGFTNQTSQLSARLAQAVADQNSTTRTLALQRDQAVAQMNLVTTRLYAVEAENFSRSNELASLNTHSDSLDEAKAHILQLERQIRTDEQHITTIATNEYIISNNLQSNLMLLAQRNVDYNRLQRNLLQKDGEIANLKQTNQDLVSQLPGLPDLTNQTNPILTGEGGIRRELLGLKGNMNNVIILLDRSSSMTNGNRWTNALAVVDDWLNYLTVQRCALVIFSDDFKAYPDRSLLPMVGPNAQANREWLIQQVKTNTPDGNTATYAALEKAYSYKNRDKADTIILFTDGGPNPPSLPEVPHLGKRGQDRNPTGTTIDGYSPPEMKRVLDLASQHPDIPINVVAVGEYYSDTNLTHFLLNLSQETKGGFLGR